VCDVGLNECYGSSCPSATTCLNQGGQWGCASDGGDASSTADATSDAQNGDAPSDVSSNDAANDSTSDGPEDVTMDVTMNDAPADVGSDAPSDASSDAGGDGGDGGGPCNALTNMGSVISVTNVAASPPAPAGGAIVGGTYLLTNVTWYDGSDAGSPMSGTYQASASVTMVGCSSIESLNGGPNERFGRVFQVINTKIDVFPSCNASLSFWDSDTGYTSNGTQLTVFESSGQTGLVFTWTKQ
jgi:hypothetical protein